MKKVKVKIFNFLSKIATKFDAEISTLSDDDNMIFWNFPLKNWISKVYFHWASNFVYTNSGKNFGVLMFSL